MRKLHIHLLGNFSLSYDGTPVLELNSIRLQSLFAYLALHRDTPTSRRSLAFLLWPDSSETQARTNLRKLIYDLRRAFPDIEHFIELDGPDIQWLPEISIRLDAEEFENASATAKSVTELKEVIDLYQGELLPACYEDWILLERQRLHQIYITTLEKLIILLEEQREYHSAITYAHRLIQQDPLQEEAYRRLMRLYALNGDRAGVLRTFHQCASTLQRELEVEPSELTREAYERLLNLDEPLSQFPSPTPRLIGRSAEWAQLQAAWREALSEKPQWVLLTGEDGVGKTRLAEELLQWAVRQGIDTASIQCYPTDTRLTYAPVTRLLRARPLPALNRIWLTEIARLLPEILEDHPNLSPPGPLNEPWQRHRLLEALARAILPSQPLILMVDDLEWSDRDSLDWLNYLMHYDPKARLLLVTPLRPANLPPDHPLISLLPALRQSDQVTEIVLQPLNESETTLLAKSVAVSNLDPKFTARVYQTTGGNPFATLEMVKSDQYTRPRNGHSSEPFSIQNAIEDRFAELSPAAQELTSLAAAVGRPIKFDELTRASEAKEEELVRGLDELWQRQIVREHAVESFGFSHSKLGEIAYAGLSANQRKALHRKIAEALIGTGEGDINILSGEIAAHFEEAGLFQRAIPYYIQAGDTARGMYANKAAIDYYQHVLRLLPEKEGIAVMLKLGETWKMIGNWSQAEALYRQALRLSENIDLSIQAQCEAVLGELLYLKGRYAEALDWLRKARILFEKLNDQRGVCEVLDSIGSVYYWQLDYTRALKHHKQQLKLASQTGDQEWVGKANGSLGLIYWQQGDSNRALSHFEQQLQIAKGLGDLSETNSALGRIGLVHWSLGDYSRAKNFFDQELQIADEIGDRLGIAFALGNIGNVFRDQGDHARALEYYAQQLEIAIGLGDRRVTSHAIRNMGSIYFEQGDYKRALSWYTRNLELALDMASRRTIGRSTGNIAVVYAAMGHFASAERLFRQTFAILPELTLPFYQCEYLYYRARLYRDQNQDDQARHLNAEARQVAEKISRKDILFETRILEIQLKVDTGEIGATAASEELEALSEEYVSTRERAAERYEVWRLNPANRKSWEEAVHLYRELYSQTPRAEYRQRYEQLTGKQLPPPPPLPDLPDSITQNLEDLDDLLQRVDQLPEQKPVVPAL
jgi:DNA-binding SARP family transcriptional activator/Tfp pilus assembly protein PilF